ncbi:hypothetical protein JTE90_002420 [Oedothorax gibbosus]|uniref:Uncharacterized protein n=1 Tax=Oedothorax gibbosus TaxID=931172 RepID=A0AAV6UTR8_9ARAC|nr:hypothetical protein JTE90_002420 [Oedothorax gibbosus]
MPLTQTVSHAFSMQIFDDYGTHAVTDAYPRIYRGRDLRRRQVVYLQAQERFETMAEEGKPVLGFRWHIPQTESHD